MNSQKQQIQLHDKAKKILESAHFNEKYGPILTEANLIKIAEELKNMRGQTHNRILFHHLGALSIELSQRGAQRFAVQLLALALIGADDAQAAAIHSDRIEQASKMHNNLVNKMHHSPSFEQPTQIGITFKGEEDNENELIVTPAPDKEDS